LLDEEIQRSLSTVYNLTCSFTVGWSFVGCQRGLKITKPTESASGCFAAYKILPANLAHVVGYALPWLEVIIALLLIIGFMVRPAAVAGGAIMLVFTAAIASVWARGLLIDCGCFGGGER
jgi:uncharacterized membrane protein YphA (DoxX/SURF4 family)